MELDSRRIISATKAVTYVCLAIETDTPIPRYRMTWAGSGWLSSYASRMLPGLLCLQSTSFSFFFVSFLSSINKALNDHLRVLSMAVIRSGVCVRAGKRGERRERLIRCMESSASETRKTRNFSFASARCLRNEPRCECDTFLN